MEERATYGAASELADATNRMKQLADEVNKLTQELHQWKLSIDVQVQADNDQKLELVITVKGKEGMTLYIPHDRVMYMANDKVGLLADVARTIIEECLVDILKADLGPKLSRAVDNIVQLSTRKSGLE